MGPTSKGRGRERMERDRMGREGRGREGREGDKMGREGRGKEGTEKEKTGKGKEEGRGRAPQRKFLDPPMTIGIQLF